MDPLDCQDGRASNGRHVGRDPEDWVQPALSRRRLLQGAGSLALLTVLQRLTPAFARTGTLSAPFGHAGAGAPIDLVIDETPFDIGGRTGKALTINGTIPGPLVRFREGDDVVLRVTNRLRESTSLHWHGLLVPPEMDGVPGVSFAGIKGGTTFEYRFPAKQSGTYWYHSHSGLQELRGVYAPLIIDPAEPEPFTYQRDYVVLLSDWTFEDADTVFDNLKKQAGFYNFQRRTAGEFFSDVGRKGLGRTLDDYLMWSKMRMDPTDFADFTGVALAFLMNGLPSEGNWTALFKSGERVRLRFINASPVTFFDVRIPGLPLTVVQADGQNVQPVAVDEFRMGPAETYDVIVEPPKAIAYTIYAEAMDRSGYARGTLAPRAGLSAPVPKPRPRPLRTMEDMGMSMQGMKGMNHPGMGAEPATPADTMMDHGNMPGMAPPDSATDHAGMPGMAPADTAVDHGAMPGMAPDSSMQHGNMPGMTHDSAMAPGAQPGATAGPPRRESEVPGATPVKHGPDTHGTGNQAVPETTRSRLSDPGTGLGNDGWRVLAYTDLRALVPYPDRRPPERELELHVTGHMERFLWSFDGKKYSQAPEPIAFRYGERLRWTFVNDTMMEHPLHLHGMFVELENGTGDYLPRKHTVIVKPAERVSVVITADARGHWAFHCHLLLHMEAGMFRVVRVADRIARAGV
jgi:CopA family copper-resistance protein